MAQLDPKAVWPGWTTTRLIGRGSFGAVYEIERDVVGIKKEKAALKLITIPQSESDVKELYDSGYDEKSVTDTFRSHMQRIVSEYTLMRELSGQTNIVSCDDFHCVPHDDNIGWDIYIKMELLTPMPQALDPRLPEAQTMRIAKDMCRALVLCRKHDIIHRDIKPQNIFVSANGDYKLGDFGIAKTIEGTSGGTKVGTYSYMAPEVYNNQPYGAQADIYSLGMVLYWLMNERRMPFYPMPPATPTAAELEQARIRRFSGQPLPPPKNGSAGLKSVVLKACAYDPKARYQSAEDMLRDLELVEAGKAPVGAAQSAQAAAFAGKAASADAGERTLGMFGQRQTQQQGYRPGGQNYGGQQQNYRQSQQPGYGQNRQQSYGQIRQDYGQSRQPGYGQSRQQSYGQNGRQGSGQAQQNTAAEKKRAWLWALIGGAATAVIVIALILLLPKSGGKSAASASRPQVGGSVSAQTDSPATPKPSSGTATQRPVPGGNSPTPAASAAPSPTPAATPAPTPTPPLQVLQVSANSNSLRDYTEFTASTASASSETSDGSTVFRAANVLDGNLNTSWQEDADGDGIGEYVIVYFGGERDIDLMRLRLGYANFYDWNGRPSSLEFEFSDGTTFTQSFADKNEDVYLQLSHTVRTNYVKMTIRSAYTGSRWDDTCITDVWFYTSLS